MRVAGGLQLAIQSPQSFQELILNLHSSFPVISCSLHGCNKSLYRPTTILLSPDSPSQIEMQHLLSLSMLNFHLNFFYAILLYSITMSKQAFDYDYLQMIKLCYLVIKKRCCCWVHIIDKTQWKLAVCTCIICSQAVSTLPLHPTNLTVKLMVVKWHRMERLG